MFLIFVAWGALAWQPHSALRAQEPAPQKTRGPDRFEAEIKAFEAYDRKNAPPADPILFVGSSTIRLWPTHEAFPDLPVLNRGFGGSTIADVNHFAKRIVFKYKPRLIVFYAGDNDLANGLSPQRVVDDFRIFVGSVRERLPATRIVFLSIKPSPRRWKLRREAMEANGRIEELAQRDQLLTFVETAPTILDERGQARKDVFRDDELHLNEKGYAAWNALLTDALKEVSQ